MVTRMHTILKRQMIKLVVAFILLLFLLLSFQIQFGRAGTSHQTIPTAPPTTAISPTVSSTGTPTITPQATLISTQPTRVISSPTPSTTILTTVETIISTPSSVSSATGLPGNGTIPILTVTLSSTEVTQISPTSTLLPTATVTSATKIPGSSRTTIYLLGGVLVIIFVIGIVWFMKLRRR
jgi:hypothetical protein